MKTINNKLNYIGDIQLGRYTRPSVEDIRNHKSMKARFKSYPTLPKYILIPRKVGEKAINVGLKYSCFRGFMDRVKNWENDHYITELEKEKKANTMHLRVYNSKKYKK